MPFTPTPSSPPSLAKIISSVVTSLPELQVEPIKTSWLHYFLNNFINIKGNTDLKKKKERLIPRPTKFRQKCDQWHSSEVTLDSPSKCIIFTIFSRNEWEKFIHQLNSSLCTCKSQKHFYLQVVIAKLPSISIRMQYCMIAFDGYHHQGKNRWSSSNPREVSACQQSA